ncbi:hypothetical protein KI387_012244, partial [Taxus chinensis]
DIEQLAIDEPKCSVWHRVTPGVKLADENLKFSSKAMEEIISPAGDSPAQEPATRKSPDGFAFGMTVLIIAVFLILILSVIICYFQPQAARCFSYSGFRIGFPDAEEGRHSQLPGEGSTSPSASTRLIHNAQVAEVQNPAVLTDWFN